MILWFRSALAALGLIGSTPAVAPSKGPAKSANPSPTSPTTTQQSGTTDGQPMPLVRP